MDKCWSVAVRSLITFYIQNALNKLTSSSHLGKSFTTLAMDFWARQFTSAAVCAL